MFATIEIRWFKEGIIPEDILAWFRNLEGEFSDQPVRADFYLQLKANDDLGIKAREGKIEIKKRKQDLGIFRLNSGLTGIIESWEKWGFNISDDSKEHENISDAESWIAVRKHRLLRKYDLTGNHIRPISPESIVNKAFNLELSSIVLFDRTCWSLNLEAYGEGNLKPDVFRKVCNYIFQEVPVNQLNGSKSCGYPQWINNISNR